MNNQSELLTRLGAECDGGGTHFSTFSSVAEGIELCLFDPFGEERRFQLSRLSDGIWGGHFPFILPGQRYGYRVHGPWDPAKGNLCSPARLLLDPCAKALEGSVTWHPSLFHDTGHKGSRADTAPYVPRSVVIDHVFDWGEDRPPLTPWETTVIYEMHVKGFTMNRADVPQELRGTYAGLAHQASLEYLTGLGITAVELLPVYSFIHRHQFSERGLKNYWGYDPICFCAPHNEYSSAGKPQEQVREFKSMVKAFHAAGLEVILDVVYNHTGEGGSDGGILSLKGFDNKSCYRLDPSNPSKYVDYTGTQNTVNSGNPFVRMMIMKSLRYWVTEMHVDGFRFDLAPALLRADAEVPNRKELIDMIQADPVLSHIKLIAEPWDLGPGGYQLGKFPAPWAEWNDKYRDTVRCFWRGDSNRRHDFALRFSGSSDIFPATRGGSRATINFVTCHDGFTLHDLVSYTGKHNWCNGDDNRDGAEDNHAWNCGVEGESEDPAVRSLRSRQKRNFLATLLLAEGVPMLLGGDETGRTQYGNNNAYCQDNAVSWLDWQWADHSLQKYVSALIALRRKLYPPVVVTRSNGAVPGDFTGSSAGSSGRPLDGDWLDSKGNPVTRAAGSQETTLMLVCKGCSNCGQARPRIAAILFNAGNAEAAFQLPSSMAAFRLTKLVDTRDEFIAPFPEELPGQQPILLCDHSQVVLGQC